MIKLILASKSKWRRERIEMAGLKCETIVSDVEENIEFNNPEEYVMELSKLKARAVAEKIEEGVVISADTIGYMNNEKFEKPKDREEAFRNIKKLSGNVNYAVTGVTLIDKYKNKEITFYEKAAVYFKEMSDEEVNWYIDNEENVYDCAGYSMETKASLFVTKIDGDYKSIVGLPISRIYSELKNFGYNINDFETIK
jgi:septum formation protein